MELTDGVIVLKPFKLEDAPVHLTNEDEEQQKWISGGKSNLKGVEDWIRKNQEYWKNDGPVFNFAAWMDGNLIGMVEANFDKNLVEGIKDGQANISYGIYSAYRGKGLALRAVELMLNFCREKKIKQAIIQVDKHNASGLRVPQKCGFKEIEEFTNTNGEVFRVFSKNLS